MRFKIAALLLAAAASDLSAQNVNSAADPALAGATTITFTGATLGQYTSFTTGNVQFTASNPAALYISNDYSGQYNTSGTSLQSSWSGFSSLRMDFLGGPVSAFGFNFGASDYSWTLSAYNGASGLLASRVISPTGESNVGDFFGLMSGGADIAYATLVSSGQGDYIFVDNFAYAGATTVTPEPGSVALMAAGLAGVAGIARRRRVRA